MDSVNVRVDSSTIVFALAIGVVAVLIGLSVATALAQF
jgi:hypothetical protein